MSEIIKYSLVAIGCCFLSSTVCGQDIEESGDEDGVVEEMVVTGSFIKRSSFEDAGSPIDVVDADQILQDGAVAKVTDFLKYVPQNTGYAPTGEAGPGGEDAPQGFGGGVVDLRGLGAASTLVLLNGQRQAGFPLSPNGLIDVNSLLPAIAIKRVEVLKDGASGVYGTDAIGGVVNFIANDDFEDIRVTTDVRAVDLDGLGSDTFTVAAMVGSQVNERIHVSAAAEYYKNAGFKKYELGFYDGADTALLTDLSSSFGGPGTYNVPTRDALGVLTGNTVETPDPDCARIQAEDITNNPSGAGTDTFFDDGTRCRLTFRTQPVVPEEERWTGRAAATSQITDEITFKGSLGATYNKTLFGGHPTTPVLAASLFGPLVVPGENPGNNFRAVDASGTPLFALPDPSDPTLALRDADGNVVLSADPTNPASGIAFNEDVGIRFRPYSTTNSNSPDEFLNENLAFRFSGALSGEFNNNWTWDTGYSYSFQRLDQRLSDSVTSKLLDGLNCELGASEDICFNPFGNSLFANPGDPEFNTEFVFQEIAAVTLDVYQSSLWVADAVAAGELFELPTGPIDIAVGVQVRNNSLRQDYDILVSSGNAAFSGAIGGGPDIEVEDRTYSLFAEAAIPVFETDIGNLDLSLAGRYEDQDKSSLSSFNPKVSALFSADKFSVRGSYAESFLVPSLFQTFGGTPGFGVIDDPLNPGIDQVPTRIGGGGPVDPQEATSFNFGVVVHPIDNLSLSADFWSFEYTDLLTVLGAQATLDRDPTGPLITRDPFSGQITLIEQPFFNAGSLETNGLDFAANYKFDTDSRGEFSIAAAAAMFTTYDFQADQLSPVLDGIGNENLDGNGVAIPEWRGNVRLNWISPDQRHEAGVVVRYQSEVTATFNPAERSDVETPVDLQYSYFVRDDRRLRLTAGLINAFDDRSNLIRIAGNALFMQNQNPIPRQFYLTLRYDL